MECMATTRSELALDGPLSSALLGLIRTRLNHVSVSPADRSVLIIEDLDQASVRALLTLLWDAGHEVLSLTPLKPTRQQQD
jgi:hypothetical protein